uniref:Uncharacterized protein n=1 Tax=Kalanchoe fedtschenkoi TaxID=63787 RepID=A0A7N0UQ04_KALFE
MAITRALDFCAGSSKEAVFFDSQPWLESDDDFYSVNGDFTPSSTPFSGNTPSHRSISATPPHPTDSTVADYKLAQSPAKRRKSLSELFKESEDEEGSNQELSSSEKETDEDTTEFSSTVEAAKSVTFAPHVSHIPEPKLTNEVEVKKKRSRKSAQHCLPKLFSVCSPNSAKKNVVAAAQ